MADIYLMTILEAEMMPWNYCEKHYPKRFEKAKKFRFDDDKFRSYGVAALLSYSLNAKDDEIKYTETGKPYIDGAKKFSISHSCEYSVVATSDCNIGCDIELTNCRHLKVAKRVFTDEEIEYMNAEPEKRFAELWTLKESVAKATGLGLAIGFNSFSVLPLINGKSITVNNQTFYGKSIVYNDYTVSYVTEDKAEDYKIENITHDMIQY